MDLVTTRRVPGYHWMGPGNDGPGSPVASYMDRVSKTHDDGYAEGYTVFTSIFTMDDEPQEKAIMADLKFIGGYLFGLGTGYMFYENFKNNGFLGGLDASFKDIFFGGIGVIAFMLNISLNLGWLLLKKYYRDFLPYAYGKYKDALVATGKAVYQVYSTVSSAVSTGINMAVSGTTKLAVSTASYANRSMRLGASTLRNALRPVNKHKGSIIKGFNYIWDKLTPIKLY